MLTPQVEQATDTDEHGVLALLASFEATLGPENDAHGVQTLRTKDFYLFDSNDDDGVGVGDFDPAAAASAAGAGTAHLRAHKPPSSGTSVADVSVNDVTMHALDLSFDAVPPASPSQPRNSMMLKTVDEHNTGSARSSASSALPTYESPPPRWDDVLPFTEAEARETSAAPTAATPSTARPTEATSSSSLPRESHLRSIPAAPPDVPDQTCAPSASVSLQRSASPREPGLLHAAVASRNGLESVPAMPAEPNSAPHAESVTAAANVSSSPVDVAPENFHESSPAMFVTSVARCIKDTPPAQDFDDFGSAPTPGNLGAELTCMAASADGPAKQKEHDRAFVLTDPLCTALGGPEPAGKRPVGGVVPMPLEDEQGTLAFNARHDRDRQSAPKAEPPLNDATVPREAAHGSPQASVEADATLSADDAEEMLPYSRSEPECAFASDPPASPPARADLDVPREVSEGGPSCPYQPRFAPARPVSGNSPEVKNDADHFLRGRPWLPVHFTMGAVMITYLKGARGRFLGSSIR